MVAARLYTKKFIIKALKAEDCKWTQLIPGKTCLIYVRYLFSRMGKLYLFTGDLLLGEDEIPKF